MKTFLREVLSTLLIAVVIYFGLRASVQHSVIVSPSMEPTLLVGQHLIINKLAYMFQEPQRGDIVVFIPTNGQQGEFIKRIIGLPGESVEIQGGTVYVHQGSKTFALDEPYIKDPASRSFKGGVIPADNYFMLGDNRNDSDDSRSGWTLPRENIVGKAWLSIWPSSRWGLAPNYPLQKEITGAQ
ncbi:MAG: signal peptidase I [Chloroflexota bacterium]